MWRLGYGYSVLIHTDSYTFKKAEPTLGQYLKINIKNESDLISIGMRWGRQEFGCYFTLKSSTKGIIWRLKTEFEILGWFIDMQASVSTKFFERYHAIRVYSLMWESPSALPARRNNLAKLHIYKSCSGLTGNLPTIHFSCWIIVFFPFFSSI